MNVCLRKKILLHLTAMLMCAGLLAGCSEDAVPVSGEVGSRDADVPAISITIGEATEGELIGEYTLGAGFVKTQADEVYDPDKRVRINKSNRPVKPIVKQDVYGRLLSDDFYYYRNALNNAERAAYDQIYAYALALDPDLDLPYPIPTDRITPVVMAVRYDNPDLFWLAHHFTYSYNDQSEVTNVTLSFYGLVDNLDYHKELFYNSADSVLEAAMSLDNDVEKVKYIHDLLTNINTYEFGELDQSSYSAIVSGRTVCAGYSAAFQYYMQRLGIPCAYVVGYAGENHAWNMVQLYGEHYNMDVTWNDPVGNPPATYYYSYFNITENQISADHTRFEDSVYLPVSNGTEYSYNAFFGNRPGSDFTSISYGSPSVSLPFVYTDGDMGEYITFDEDEYGYDDSGEDAGYDDGDAYSYLSTLTEEEWEEIWDYLDENLTEEEWEIIEEMSWDEFYDYILWLITE